MSNVCLMLSSCEVESLRGPNLTNASLNVIQFGSVCYCNDCRVLLFCCVTLKSVNSSVCVSAVRTRLRCLDSLHHARSLLRLGLRLLPRGLPLLPPPGVPAGPHPALHRPAGTDLLGSALSHVQTDKDPPGLGEPETPAPNQPGAT